MDNLWFFIAIVPPLLYAGINQIDKFLLERYFKEGGVGTLLLFSTLFSFFLIPYALIMDPHVLNVGADSMFVMLIVGILNVVLLVCYLKAMEGDDPTVVIIYYQLVPVIALVMSYFVLGETISKSDGFAMAIILVGTTIATLELEPGRRIRFRWNTFVLMTTAASCWAAETTLGKIVVIDENVFAAILWESIAMIFLGVAIFFGVPSYRNHFLSAFKMNSKSIIGLNIFSEALYQVGNGAATHAVKLAPVALVLLVQPFQAIFVFLIGVILRYILPTPLLGDLSRRQVAQQVLAISISGAGTYVLLR